MSFDYTACFTHLGVVEASTLQATLASFAIHFCGSYSTLVYNGRWVQEQQGARRDWAGFAADAVSARPSAFAQFKGDGFRFTFGFLTLPPAVGVAGAAELRAAWLVISDGDLERMGYALEDQGTDIIKLFVALFRALNAGSMAMGVELSARQFLQFLAGQLPLAEMDERVDLAIAPPAASAAAMRGNPGTRDLNVDGTPVLARYFVGLEPYFPRPTTPRR
ncbi:MAG: hypothetical protein ABI548_20490 [Polyangiaceae bacterium]